MKLVLFFLVLVALTSLSLVSVRAEKEEAPTLKILQGILKGVTGKSRGGRPFYNFKGIPYGQVKQRFEESILAPSWEGVKDVSEFGAECAQQLLGGDEDCLHVNVYTPKLNPSGKDTETWPVIFFIHGGAFILGSSNIYGADYWMDENVVVVTINYRLGLFGFLNLEIDSAPGNQGLKDQILALKWVQLNIAFFNGDKKRVTIVGESAGAGSVSYLLVTPLSEGLFHAAISQSGTSLCPWALNPDGVEHAKALAVKMNCTGNDEQIVTCLRQFDVTELYKAIPMNLIPKDLGKNKKGGSMLKAMSFVPTIETRQPTDKSTIYLPKPAVEMLRQGNFRNVPWIVGANEYEGYLFQAKFPLSKFKTPAEIKAAWLSIAGATLSLERRPESEVLEIGEKVAKFYFADRTQVDENLTNVCSDWNFFYCSKLAAQYHSKKAPVYLYYFEKRGAFSLMSFAMRSDPPIRPTHADELTYEWKFNSEFISDMSDIGTDHQLFSFSKDFVKMMVHFGATGKPTQEWNTKKITWEPLDPSKPAKWLHLDTDAQLQPEDEEFKSRLKFWNDLNLI